MTAPIAETERGHRRGVVLGFTMAELLLLLLFCLLLISATALLAKDKEITALQQQVEASAGISKSDIPRNALQLQILLKMLFPAGVPPLKDADFAKLWEKLVLARDMEGLATSVGLESPEQLKQLLTVWGDMQGRFASEAEMAKLLSLLERLVAAGAGTLTPDQMEVLVKESSRLTSSSDPPGSRWPPIISLDGNRYRFEIGSAEITSGFQEYLEDEAAVKIAGLLQQYNADVIEIVGHTDEQVIQPNIEKTSNLDLLAIPAVNGVPGIHLTPVDNAGLGLARAIEVARVLRQQPELAGVRMVPLSAGQLIRKGDLLSPGSGQALNDPDRRRIEIRVRRSTPEAN
ncbi:OmpA family protein [Devosia sp. A16]|uniref:OmpA family protein n=1 Tax=Devosia sp. A16 TaxID=1736675 RepID=UPI0006D7812A|nr:OmpA family protein [Devosia sp. A16]